MKLLTFEHDGRTSYGAATEAGVIDVGVHLGERYPGLLQVVS